MTHFLVWLNECDEAMSGRKWKAANLNVVRRHGMFMKDLIEQTENEVQEEEVVDNVNMATAVTQIIFFVTCLLLS